jgi:hypothetical protein
MPNSKVLQAELTPEASISVTVELSHLEPGEQALVQTTVTQAAAVAEATALVTGASPAGPQRARLLAVPRGGNRFTPDEPLVAFTQATTVWTTRLTPLKAVGTPPRHLWGDGSDEPY